MTFGERLKQFIDYKKISVRAFELECDLKNGTVYRVIKNGTSLNGESIAAIGRAWINLDLNWLLIGIGEMLKIESSDKPVTEEMKDGLIDLDKFGIQAQLSRADKQIELQQEMISFLKEVIKDQKKEGQVSKS